MATDLTILLENGGGGGSSGGGGGGGGVLCCKGKAGWEGHWAEEVGRAYVHTHTSSFSIQPENEMQHLLYAR